jgi:RNA polymerase sigma-70 factor (ECF subfamily)
MFTVVMEQRPPVMARAASGDPDAFASLVQPLLGPAYSLAAVMLADRSAAEDAVQEASIKAWRKFGQFRGEVGALRSWFLSIVANECRMARRQRWWSVIRLAEPRGPVGVDEAASDTSSDLKAALLHLSADERLPLVLHFYLDLPLDEVARTLGVSPAAAKSRIYRAAQKLRKDLTPEEVF